MPYTSSDRLECHQRRRGRSNDSRLSTTPLKNKKEEETQQHTSTAHAAKHGGRRKKKRNKKLKENFQTLHIYLIDHHPRADMAVGTLCGAMRRPSTVATYTHTHRHPGQQTHICPNNFLAPGRRRLNLFQLFQTHFSSFTTFCRFN